MKTKLKKVPRFQKSEQEAQFWESHSVSDYQLIPADIDEVLDELKAKHRVKQNMTFRLEPELMRRLKKRAKKSGIKYQTFVREWLWRAVA